MIYLESERLYLRGWRADDLEPFAAMNADQKVMSYFPAALSREQSDGFAKRHRQSLNEDGYGLYAVEEKASGSFIGFVGFARATFPASFTPALEIGWRLAFSAWGKGFATEAARVCLSHGFTECRFDALVSFTTRRNKRSIAVMERLGMRRNPDEDFDHPYFPVGHAQRRHVLYRIRNPANTILR